jgi:MYND finger/Armadillo/beta-catenin-like repeat
MIPSSSAGGERPRVIPRESARAGAAAAAPGAAAGAFGDQSSARSRDCESSVDGRGGGCASGERTCECAVCGSPAALRCKQCRAAWYCGPKCQRGAWGDHKTACAASVSAVAAAAPAKPDGVRESSSGGGGSSDSAEAAGAASAGARGIVAAATGGLDKAAHEQIQEAVALLRSKRRAHRSRGAMTLSGVFAGGPVENNRFRTEFQEALFNAGALQMLVKVLRSRHSDEGQSAAAYVMRVVATLNKEGAVRLIAAGAVLHLVAHLTSKSGRVQRSAAAALAMVYNSEVTNWADVGADSGAGLSAQVQLVSAQRTEHLSKADSSAIVAAGALNPLISLLVSASIDSQRHAARALDSMSVSVHSAIHAKGGIPLLVTLLSSTSLEVQMHSAGALCGLCKYAGFLSDERAYVDAIVAAGGISPLIALLSTPSVLVQESAAGVLWRISAEIASGIAIVQAGGLRPLIALLDSSSDDVVMVVARMIRDMCLEDANATAFAAAGGTEALFRMRLSSIALVRRDCAIALFLVAVRDAYIGRTMIVEQIGIEYLYVLLKSHDSELLRARGAHVVAFLASDRDARAAVVGAGAITRLVELLNTSSMEVARCASGALTNLVESAANVNEIAILGRRAITTLVALLESRIEEVQKQAAASLRRLSNTLPNQIAIASAGGIFRLLTLVSASSGATRVDAAAALANVSEIPANSVAIAEAGGISTAVALMLSASIDLQTSGACVTHNMSALDSSVERIVSAGAAVPLGALLHSGQVQSQEYAAGALQNLSMHHVGRAALAQSDGIVRHLIALLDSKSTSASLASIFRSAGVLSNLGLSIEHLVAMVSAGAIPHVVQLLVCAPNAAKVYAARALSSLSGSHAMVIISAGALAPLIDLLRYSASVSVLEAAADALFHLSAVPEHRAALARAGAIPAVIGLLLVSQSPLVQKYKYKYKYKIYL